MVVTPEGTLTLVSSVQFWNAPAPMEVTESGMVTVVAVEFSAMAPAGISVTRKVPPPVVMVSGMATLSAVDSMLPTETVPSTLLPCESVVAVLSVTVMSTVVEPPLPPVVLPVPPGAAGALGISMPVVDSPTSGTGSGAGVEGT